jgi:hypothetical protein
MGTWAPRFGRSTIAVRTRLEKHHYRLNQPMARAAAA